MTGPRSLFAEPPRFMAREECEALGKRVLSFATANFTQVNILGYSSGNLRWASNRPSTSGESSNVRLRIGSTVGTRAAEMTTNKLDDASLRAAVAESERLASESGGSAGGGRLAPPQVYVDPKIWSDASYGLDAGARAAAAKQLVEPADSRQLRSAGYIEVGVRGDAVINSMGVFAYHAYTQAQYSVTVRTPDGSGSGWAGVSDHDWARIDSAALNRRALDKCESSANPSALEPGRYTLIMEPQAVADLVRKVIDYLGRGEAATGGTAFSDPGAPDRTKIGQRVFDERISLSTDPLDPDGGYRPFTGEGAPYRKVTWIESGVVKELAYDRFFAHGRALDPRGLPNSYSIRMSGGDTSIEEMIATTRRGLLVTRFHGTSVVDQFSLLCTGNTRDGLWLIENGKIKQPVKNFRFNESPMFVFNNVVQLGTPVRAFNPNQYPFNPWKPLIVPPIKVRDFNFTSLSDAV
jgi:predicted Zn-dependent protease